MDVNLTFDASAAKDILNFFGKKINDDNLVVEAETEQPVLGLDGSEVLECEFAGIKNGSEIFLKKDIISMMKLVNDTK